MNKHQTAVAAEAFAAGVLAHSALSVFVQYGANQPGYDLLVSDGNDSVMVSVKGSTDGWWVLAVKDKTDTYQEVLDRWVSANCRYAFCLVQFSGVEPGTMPPMYFATGDEIGVELRTHHFGEVSLALAKHRAPTRGKNKSKTMGIPPSWRMTEERIREVVQRLAEQRAAAPPCTAGLSPRVGSRGE